MILLWVVKASCFQNAINPGTTGRCHQSLPLSVRQLSISSSMPRNAFRGNRNVTGGRMKHQVSGSCSILSGPYRGPLEIRTEEKAPTEGPKLIGVIHSLLPLWAGCQHPDTGLKERRWGWRHQCSLDTNKVAVTWSKAPHEFTYSRPSEGSLLLFSKRRKQA